MQTTAAWLHATATTLPDMIHGRLELARSRERGAATLEYVVIAGALFVAAVGLATWIGKAIATRQNAIQP